MKNSDMARKAVIATEMPGISRNGNMGMSILNEQFKAVNERLQAIEQRLTNDDHTAWLAKVDADCGAIVLDGSKNWEDLVAYRRDYVLAKEDTIPNDVFKIATSVIAGWEMQMKQRLEDEDTLRREHKTAGRIDSHADGKRVAQIVNYDAFLTHLREHPDILATMEKLANRYLHARMEAPPGVEYMTKEEAQQWRESRSFP